MEVEVIAPTEYAADLSPGFQATTTRIGKGQQELRDVPQSVTVVTERLLDDRNFDTLKEALHNTAGISFLAAGAVAPTSPASAAAPAAAPADSAGSANTTKAALGSTERLAAADNHGVRLQRITPFEGWVQRLNADRQSRLSHRINDPLS